MVLSLKGLETKLLDKEWKNVFTICGLVRFSIQTQTSNYLPSRLLSQFQTVVKPKPKPKQFSNYFWNPIENFSNQEHWLTTAITVWRYL